MIKNIKRLVVKLFLKSDLPIIKNHLTTTNIKWNETFQGSMES